MLAVFALPIENVPLVHLTTRWRRLGGSLKSSLVIDLIKIEDDDDARRRMPGCD